ncbi:MAG: T9SS type A sorting domain-containing protein [Flavobacteriales bacterium]
MKKIINRHSALMCLSAVLSFSIPYNVVSQCTNSNAYMTATAPTNTTPLTISSCTFQTEYNTINSVVAGQTYVSSSSCGGYITVRRGTFNGPVVASGNSPLTWTATVSGTHYIHYNTNAFCGTATSCCTTTITCTSCGGGGGGGCINNSAFGTATAPTNTTALTISTCTFQTEYNTINSVVAGQTYVSSSSCGGYITVRSGAFNGPVVASGNSPLTWTATVGGTHYIHYNTNSGCGTATSCCTTTITCTSCGAVAGPCANVPNITCGQSTTANFSGSGAWNVTACGFTTSGQEVIYEFTPTNSGNHSINITNASGGFIDYFWKPVTSGCSSTGWNCIGDFWTTGTFGSFNLTAGTAYYILLDAESTFAASHTFNIVCPTTGPVTASECANAINVCTNLSFAVNPNGFGAINELCTCCTSNPCTNPASANQGCLLAGELNSTWMIVNITTAGTLQFSFGAPGGSVCYDWAMWPYTPTTCNQIISNSIAPIRCNWNATCQGFTGISAPPPAGGAAGDFEPNLNVAANTQYVICFSNYSSATTTVPLNFFGTATVSCSALPIDMIDFYGKALEAYNELTWATASEIFNSHFDVERSPDGYNFFKIGEVGGAGNSTSVTQYSFNDHQVVGTKNYYRLKQVDFNGAYRYSEIIIIENNYNGLFTVVGAYPNPANDVFNVAVQVEMETRLQVSITDLSGKIIQQETIMVAAGSNRIEIPVSQMAKGLYMVSLTDERTKRTEKVKLAIH